MVFKSLYLIYTSIWFIFFWYRLVILFLNLGQAFRRTIFIILFNLPRFLDILEVFLVISALLLKYFADEFCILVAHSSYLCRFFDLNSLSKY